MKKLSTNVEDAEAVQIAIRAQARGYTVAQFIRWKLDLEPERKVGAPKGDRNGRMKARLEREGRNSPESV